MLNRTNDICHPMVQNDCSTFAMLKISSAYLANLVKSYIHQPIFYHLFGNLWTLLCTIFLENTLTFTVPRRFFQRIAIKTPDRKYLCTLCVPIFS